jgi:hypothetical protein
LAKEKLAAMIRQGKISPGTIIGVFYTASLNNRPGRPFTHMMVYAGNNLFWHNFFGPKTISLEEIYSTAKKGKRIFYPVMVCEPK